MHRRKLWTLVGVAGLAAGGCGGDKSLDTPAPTSVEMVASGGFEEPMDAVASPDGKTFFFSAHATEAADLEADAAIFAVGSDGGTPQMLHVGEPLRDPTGLLMSCDGSTLFVADIGHADGEFDPDLDTVETAPVYTMDVAAGTLSPLSITGVAEAASLAFDTNCDNLYITGYTADGEPALFKAPPGGGQAQIVTSGAPLSAPSGVFVDTDDVAWVMDTLPDNGLGGALFQITDDGTTTIVIDGLQISEPAGVSLTAQGRVAVIPSRDADDQGQLITVDIDTLDMTIVTPSQQMLEPAGIRTARNASIMAVVDADGDAIFAAK